MTHVIKAFGPEHTDPEDRIEQLQRELESLDGRDLEIWAIGASLGLIVVGVLLLTLFPALVWNFKNFIHESDSSPELVLGLFMLVLLLNAYLYYERHRIRVSRRELLRQLLIVEKSAQLDPLTGAFNRRCLNQLLQKEISRAERKGSKLSVILADVNDFKAFNTRFGHLVGDEVLSQVAKILASALRASDTIVRYGGDEFVVILGDTDRQQAGVAVNRINEYLQAWNRKERAMRMEVTVTCGIAEFTKGWSATELINRADAEMLAGKTASKARILDASQ